MLNKTIRSTLSLALVFCLLLGLCGNALAVSIPGAAAVDNRFNAIIEQLESVIDDLEAQIKEHEATLDDGEAKLEDGKAKLEEGKEKLAELKQLLADAQNAIDEEGGYQDQLNAAYAAWEAADALWQEYMGEYEDKCTELENAKTELEKAKAELGLAALQQAMEEAQAAYDAKFAELGGAALMEKIDAANERIAELEVLINEKIAELFPEDVKALEDAQLAMDQANAALWEKYDEIDALVAPLQEKYDEKFAELAAPFDKKLADLEQAAIDAENYYYELEAAGASQNELDDALAAAEAALLAYEDYYWGWGSGTYWADIDGVYQDEALMAIQAEIDAVREAVIPYEDAYYEANELYWNAYYALQAKRNDPALEELNTESDELSAQVSQWWSDYYAIYSNPELEPYSQALNKANMAYDDVYWQVWDQIWPYEQKIWEAEDALWEAQMQLDEARLQLDEALMQLNEAQAQLDEAHVVIADAEEAIEVVEAEMEKAEGIIADAEAIIADARPAIEQAYATIADARALIDSIKQAYADLQDAINNPEANAAFVKELVLTMQADMTELWNGVLTLQESIDALILAYEPLEGKVLSYPGFNYHHDAVHYELPNGDVYDYPEVNVNIEGFDYNMPQLPASVEKLSNTLDTWIARVLNAYNTARYYWLLAKDKFDLDITVSLETVQKLTAENLKKVYNWLYENPDKVCAYVKEYGLYALDLLAKYGPYAEDFLRNHSDLVVKVLKLAGGAAYLGAEYLYAHSAGVMGFVGKAMDFVLQYKDQVLNIARKLYNKYGDEAKALINVYVDYLGLEERYADAIHADYTVYHDSLYVAIGDGTAVDGYVENLAQLLGIAHITENLAQEGLTVGEAMDLVAANAELIGKADLITLGFGNDVAATEMVNALMGEKTTNWTGAVGETVTNAINRGLEMLRERLAADGYNVDILDTVVAAASAYAFAYAARAIQYPELVKAVRETNPDALIVLVGSYNDLDGVTLTIGGREVNVGNYTKYLIHAANLENLLQAMYSENVIYVSAFDAETILAANGAEDLNALGYMAKIYAGELMPSEAGHAYIAEQIFNALTVEYKVWGDVNGDHAVTCCDVYQILQYAMGYIADEDLAELGLDMSWADVDGDGYVTTVDVNLVLNYAMGYIEHFPVCG